MKVKLKAVLKTTETNFQPFQQNQFIFHAGNTLTIKQFHKPSCQFIHLNKELTQLFSFKPTPSKQGCFVAEKLTHQKISVSLYTLKKQRKAVSLTDSQYFFPSSAHVESVELLVDQFDSNLVYGYAKAGPDTCIFLVDFIKLKIVSIGFVASFNDIKVNAFENLTLSFCNGNTLRKAHIYNGFWQTEEKIFKKLGNVNVIKHQIFHDSVVLLSTKTHMYFVGENSQIIQTISVFQNNNDEIHEIIKLPKALLVLSKKQKMKIFIEDHDELTFLYKGELFIKLKQNQRINKIAVSSNCQQVLLRTSINQIFVWKVEDLEVLNEIVYEFQKIQNGTIGESKGTLSLASGKQTALLATNNSISLWDLEKNVGFLQTTFSKFDKHSQKAVYSAALNPDGNSLICAFEDKVKIYKILLTKLRFIAEFNIKRCSQLYYSHGGQYVACRFGKGTNSSLAILNTLRMVQINTIKTHAEPNFVLWNQMDNQLIVSTNNNLITAYKISDNSKVYSVKIPTEITMVRMDYGTKKLLISCENQIYVVCRDKIEKTIQPTIPKFNFIYPLHGIYFIATKSGNLYWSNQITFETYQEMPVFINHTFSLTYRNGYMLASNSFQNIMILQCIRENLPEKKQILKTSENIVFVEKDQINRFFQKIKNLESSLEALQGATTQRLQEQKKKYDRTLHENTQKFEGEIAYLQKRFHEINGQKLKQQKENSRVFDELQSGQIKCVNDLEKMYDRKLKLEKQKCLEIEQKNVEQRVHYEKVIYELERRYHQDITNIREEYSNKLSQQFKRIEETKRNDLDYKKKMEYKLISVEEESEMTLFEVQKVKDKRIQELKNKIIRLQNQENSNKVEFYNELNRYKKMQETFTEIEEELRKNKQKLAEAQQRIKLMSSEVQMKNKMVGQRNNVISQQDHLIGGLQKAKYVLSFRTTQIRKQIEPKESLIEKLKHEMFKLEGEYKEEKRRLFEMHQKVEKVDKLNKIIKEENIQLALKFKNKEKAHDQISGEIFTIVNQMDQKQWPAALVKVYQTYIKEDHFKNMRKKTKDDTSQEINRHLIHVEQQLMQVTAGNQKVFKAKELDVKRKMKQNADLILDFNQLKKSYNQSLKMIDQYKVKVSKLQQEIHEFSVGTTRANTAKSGRRTMSRERGDDKADLSNIDMSFKRQSQLYFDKRQNTTRQSRSRASSIGYRTMALRSDKKQSSRFFDLAKELEGARYKIQKQQQMIEQLNQRLLNQTLE